MEMIGSRQLLIAIFLLAPLAGAASEQDAEFRTLAEAFAEDYAGLDLPGLQLSYLENLRAIKPPRHLERQEAMFSRYWPQLSGLETAGLGVCSQIHYEILNYEISLNLERIALERRFVAEMAGAAAPSDGLASVPLGHDLYRYFLKRWLTVDWTPEEIFAFGEKEIAEATAQYRQIQREMGFEGRDQAFLDHLNGDQFFEREEAAILQAYHEKQEIVRNGLTNVFQNYPIVAAGIKKSDQGANVPAPGFYNNNTFFFNIFSDRYNRRQMDWLYIHEAEPGHHFQLTHELTLSDCRAGRPPFSYGVFREGWGAYVEELGADIGLYRTPADLLGKIEWDLIRSTRVPLDVGLNYYGWSDEEALAYWKKHIKGQDDIGRREINRMKNWPVQVLTYKVGAEVILELKSESQAAWGADFNVRDFHDGILRYGSLPLRLLQTYGYSR